MEKGPRLHVHNFFCESHLCRKHQSDPMGLHGVPPREPKSGRANSSGPRASRSMLKDNALTQVLAMAASYDALAPSSVGPHSHRPPQTGSRQIRRRGDGGHGLQLLESIFCLLEVPVGSGMGSPCTLEGRRNFVFCEFTTCAYRAGGVRSGAPASQPNSTWDGTPPWQNTASPATSTPSPG